MLAPTAHRAQGWIVDIGDATDPGSCGGKAVGLAALVRMGAPVPRALCLTTEVYRHWLEVSGLGSHLAELVAAARATADRREILQEMRRQIETTPLGDDIDGVLRARVAALTAGADGLLSVRSSGVDEDHPDASHAGIHTSVVVDDDPSAVGAAIKTCWASLWTETAWAYRERLDLPHAEAVMAVIVQRFVAAVGAGVVFSVDPLTNDPTTAVIEAGWGTGAALVAGTMTPDEYRVSLNGADTGRVCRRPGQQTTMNVWRDHQEATVPLDDTRRGRPVLSDAHVRELVRIAKAVERARGVPVDVEWVFDGERLWAVQARPITSLAATSRASQRGPTLWTRANLKEVFPELPSPLALSYLTLSLNRMFRSYHAAHGYALAPDTTLVSVIRGRPYLNLSLMQRMTVERGGDPEVVGRLFGGASPTEVGLSAPASSGRVPRTGRARLACEMLATLFRTPRRGRRLFRRLRRQAAALARTPLAELDERELSAHFDRFGSALLDETTLRRLHEVVSAQSRAYMVVEALLAAWVPSDADIVLTRLMTGLGTLPNVQMTYRLMDLAALTAREPRARAYFMGDLNEEALRQYETALAGTAVLPGLRAFLQEFGHRGPYESDVMSARFADDPGPLLRLLQLHVRAEGRRDAACHAAERSRIRRSSLSALRSALGRDRGPLAFAARWTVFRTVCRALQQLLALRDECRHVTTMMVAHLRRVALEIGRRARGAGILTQPTDVFFLTWEEVPRILIEPDGPWCELVAERRLRREHDARQPVPDVISGDDGAAVGAVAEVAGEEQMRGYGVSPGIVTGRVRVLRSMEAIGRLSGEIVVLAAIEPTMTPIFPLVRGFIAEMGGLLSHAAILAREYGLPAVVSVRGATRRLRDGDRVELDGTTGCIRVLERAA